MRKILFITILFCFFPTISLAQNQPIELPANGGGASAGQQSDGTIIYKTLVYIPGVGEPDGSSSRITIEPTSLATFLKTIFNYVIGLALMLAFIAIVYGGVKYATSDAIMGKSEGKKVITDAFLGLALALGAWLILYTIDPNLLSFDLNIGSTQYLNNQGGKGTVMILPSGFAISVGGDQTLGQGACSSERISQGAAAGGYSITPAQANTLSCIAKAESGCGTNMTGARTVGGTQTSASGMFQVVFGYNDTCHNLNIPVCTQAAQRAGYQVAGNLNCSRHFRGGVPTDQIGQACRAAALNTDCNASAAACLLKQNPSFSDWTADPRSSKQRACINQFNH